MVDLWDRLNRRKADEDTKRRQMGLVLSVASVTERCCRQVSPKQKYPLYLRFCAAKPERLWLAGVAGFEPANAGIKTRCLTTWPHPNFSEVPHPPRRCRRQSPMARNRLRGRTLPILEDLRTGLCGVIGALFCGWGPQPVKRLWNQRVKMVSRIRYPGLSALMRVGMGGSPLASNRS